MKTIRRFATWFGICAWLFLIAAPQGIAAPPPENNFDPMLPPGTTPTQPPSQPDPVEFYSLQEWDFLSGMFLEESVLSLDGQTLTTLEQDMILKLEVIDPNTQEPLSGLMATLLQVGTGYEIGLESLTTEEHQFILSIGNQTYEIPSDGTLRFESNFLSLVSFQGQPVDPSYAPIKNGVTYKLKAHNVFIELRKHPSLWTPPPQDDTVGNGEEDMKDQGTNNFEDESTSLNGNSNGNSFPVFNPENPMAPESTSCSLHAAGAATNFAWISYLAGLLLLGIWRKIRF